MPGINSRASNFLDTSVSFASIASTILCLEIRRYPSFGSATISRKTSFVMTSEIIGRSGLEKSIVIDPRLLQLLRLLRALRRQAFGGGCGLLVGCATHGLALLQVF